MTSPEHGECVVFQLGTVLLDWCQLGTISSQHDVCDQVKTAVMMHVNDPIAEVTGPRLKRSRDGMVVVT